MSSESPPSYLIIGGGTPLGEAIVKLLLSRGGDSRRKDASIAILDAHPFPQEQAELLGSQVRLFIGDMQSPKQLLGILESSQQTCVIHTGALSTADALRVVYPSPADPPLATTEPNPSRAVMEAECAAAINGTRNLISAMLEHGTSKQLLYVSNADIVFNGKERPDLCEEDAPYLKHCWKPEQEGRAQSERLVLEANGKNGLATAAIRPAMIYGRTPREFHTLAKQEGLYHIDNNARRIDRTFMDNAAHACLLAADRLSPEHRQHAATVGRAFFITDGEARHIWDFSQDLRVAAFNTVPPEPIIVSGTAVLASAELRSFSFWGRKRKGESRADAVATNYAMCVTRTYNISRAKEVLEYAPIVSYDEGVRMTAECMAGYM